MYLVYGIDHDGNESKRLEYESLEEALHKVGDLMGADEIDSNGPMFREYGLAIDPMPQGPCTEGLYDEDGNRLPAPPREICRTSEQFRRRMSRRSCG